MTTERDLMEIRLAATYGALHMPRSLHTCPFCDWSVLHDGWDPEGLEEVLRDHLDTEHKGWTMESIEAAIAVGKGDAE